MAVTSIDPISAFAPPPRAADAPRGGDVDRSFAPALEQAYKDERPKDVRPPRRDDLTKTDDTAPPQTKPVESRHEQSGKHSDDSQAAADADAKPAEHAEHDKEHPKDSTDISDDAAAEAAVASGEVKPAKEVTAAVEKTLAAEQAAKVEKTQGAKAKPEDAPAEAAGAAKSKAKEQTAQQKGGEEAAAALHGSKDAKSKKAATAHEEQSAGDKKQQSAKNGNNSGKQAEGEIQATQAVAAQPKAANTAAAKPDPTGAVKGDKADSAPQAKKPKAARDDASPLLNQPKADAAKPPVVAKPDQAAAAAQAVAAPHVQLAKDAAKVELSAKPKTDAIGSTSALSKNSATLDRLAARAMRTGESESSSNLPAIDKNRFVQRVEGALRAAQQRDGRIQVRLSPPELGNLRIELAVQNGVMHAKVEAETPAARNALLDNLPALRDRLAQQDIRVEKFEVDLRRDFNGGAGGGQTFDRPSGQPDSGRQEGRPRAPAPRITTVAAARPAAAAANVSDAALDVRI